MVKKNQESYLFVILGVLLLLAFSPNLTGAAVSGVETNLHDSALRFFEVEDIEFPEGACPLTAQELYWDLSHEAVDESKGYSTTSQARISTTAFVLDRDKYGIIDFVKFPAYLEDRDADSFIALSSEAIVRVPKYQRKTFLTMELYGHTGEKVMHITKGRFSTPSTDCIFMKKGDEILCDCDLHPHTGIALGGVSASIKIEENYEKLLSEPPGFSPLK